MTTEQENNEYLETCIKKAEKSWEDVPDAGAWLDQVRGREITTNIGGTKMTLEKQVCTLEQAKRLKELGCKQESWFSWVTDLILGREALIGRNQSVWLGSSIKYKILAPAYTVAELGEMLVNANKGRKARMPEPTAKIDNELYWWHPHLVDVDSTGCIQFPTEAQARTALFIHILEQEKEHGN